VGPGNTAAQQGSETLRSRRHSSAEAGRRASGAGEEAYHATSDEEEASRDAGAACAAAGEARSESSGATPSSGGSEGEEAWKEALSTRLTATVVLIGTSVLIARSIVNATKAIDVIGATTCPLLMLAVPAWLTSEIVGERLRKRGRTTELFFIRLMVGSFYLYSIVCGLVVTHSFVCPMRRDLAIHLRESFSGSGCDEHHGLSISKGC
jgi:hypothetical protein